MEIPTSEYFLEKLSLEEMKDTVVEQIKILGGICYLTSSSDPDVLIRASENDFKAFVSECLAGTKVGNFTAKQIMIQLIKNLSKVIRKNREKELSELREAAMMARTSTEIKVERNTTPVPSTSGNTASVPQEIMITTSKQSTNWENNIPIFRGTEKKYR